MLQVTPKQVLIVNEAKHTGEIACTVFRIHREGINPASNLVKRDDFLTIMGVDLSVTLQSCYTQKSNLGARA